MKTRQLLALIALCTSRIASADDSICPPLAKIAHAVALEREAGKDKSQAFLDLVHTGKIDPKSSTVEWAANTVVWVYNEHVSSKTAEKRMLAKCRVALSKHK